MTSLQSEGGLFILLLLILGDFEPLPTENPPPSASNSGGIRALRLGWRNRGRG